MRPLSLLFTRICFVGLSLAPGFNRVGLGATTSQNRFNGLAVRMETVKTVEAASAPTHPVETGC